MKNIELKLTLLALMPAALLTFTSCKSGTEGQDSVSVVETRNGAMILDTRTVTAKVTAIDANTRKITLTTPDGHKTTYKVPPDVDLSQARLGEKITVEGTEEIAVFLSKPGTPTSVAAGATVAVAARGHESGALTTETEEVTARITALNLKTRKVTLQFVDGTTRTIKVGKDVNLSVVQVGDDVTAQVAQSVAVMVKT